MPRCALLCVYVCVCVCVRERERERERNIQENKIEQSFKKRGPNFETKHEMHKTLKKSMKFLKKLTNLNKSEQARVTENINEKMHKALNFFHFQTCRSVLTPLRICL
jgi:hypothetical protein